MRALILETINKRSDEAARETSKDDQSKELVLGMSEMLEPIADLDNLLEVSSLMSDSSCPVRYCCSITDRV